jgi:hypothetical protein
VPSASAMRVCRPCSQLRTASASKVESVIGLWGAARDPGHGDVRQMEKRRENVRKTPGSYAPRPAARIPATNCRSAG